MDKLASTSEQILACARSLIVAGGYNGFSYADIADVVGIRKASIHHHFPAKAELVRTLVNRYCQDAEAGIAHMRRTAPGPVEQLHLYVGHWEACIEDGSRPFCVCALLASEVPVLPPEVAAEVKAYFRLLSSWITSAMEQGEQQGTLRLLHKPDVEAQIFMATVHGAMLSARAYGDPAMFKLVTAPLFEKLSARP